MIEVGDNRYGKEAIRLVRLIRGAERHAVRDLTVSIALEGDFDASYKDGDNALVIATDTMKNTVYAFAADGLDGRDGVDGSIEAFGRRLAEHFASFGQVDRATVRLREHRWGPIATADGPATDAFARDGSWTRIATVSAAGDSTAGRDSTAGGDSKAGGGSIAIEAGIEDLSVMKTAKSSFAGFPRDEFTTLAETADRIMATQVSVRWRYLSPDIDHDAVFEAVRRMFLEVFAEHNSPSVQASIWIVGRAILERHPELAEITLTMPNLHHWAVDLRPFGLENRGEVFVPTREPYGLIEATVRRG
ncbi:MAG: factor-independent urate hydroxylase [Candidatus Limnocylindrales bacterium]